MSDRDAILRRRAAFLAATLGGLGAPKLALAADCTDPATHAAVSSDVMLERVNQLAESGRHAAARRALHALRHCAPEREDDLALWEDELVARTAQLDVVTYPPSGVEIFIDGIAQGTMPLVEPVFVDAGVHVITARAEGYGDARKEIAVAGGARISVELLLGTPQVCLSILPPTFASERKGVQAGLGGSPITGWISPGGTSQIGPVGEYFFSFGMGRFSCLVGPVGAASFSERGVGVTLGGRASTRMGISSFAVGLGASAGYFWAPEDPEPPENEVPTTVTSFYVQPELTLQMHMGPVDVGPRFGFMMSRREQGLAGEFGLTHVTAGIFIHYVREVGR